MKSSICVYMCVCNHISTLANLRTFNPVVLTFFGDICHEGYKIMIFFPSLLPFFQHSLSLFFVQFGGINDFHFIINKFYNLFCNLFNYNKLKSFFLDDQIVPNLTFLNPSYSSRCLIDMIPLVLQCFLVYWHNMTWIFLYFPFANLK